MIHSAIKSSQLRVERALIAHLTFPVDPPVERLVAAMRYATLNGGKRIRACLIYAAGELVDANPRMLDDAACSVELIHSYSLIHDDLPCMDDDDLRRGKPTCHRAFDEATALLAGDALQGLAFQILADGDEPGRIRMIRLLAGAIGSHGMAGGQAMDLGAVGRTLSADELESMHRFKTAALINAAVMLGINAAATPPGSKMQRALEQYGWAIGLAFQIVDDILDEEGEVQILGKTPGSDRARGKPTYPTVLGTEAAKTRARELEAIALESLGPLGDNAGSLRNLATYIVQRDQ